MSSFLLLLMLLGMPKQTYEMQAALRLERFFEGGMAGNLGFGLGPLIFNLAFGDQNKQLSENEKYKMLMELNDSQVNRILKIIEDDWHGYTHHDDPIITFPEKDGLTEYSLKMKYGMDANGNCLMGICSLEQYTSPQIIWNGDEFVTTHHDQARKPENFPPGYDPKTYRKRKGEPGWIEPGGTIIMPDKAGHGGPHWKRYTPDGKIRVADVGPNGEILWPNGPKNKARKP